MAVPSLVPSSFPPPVPPDFHHCNLYYSEKQPPLFSDCVAAWNALPSGSESIPWYTKPGEGESHGLPLTEVYGTCAIEFHASGQYVEEHTAQFKFAPDMIRKIAGWVIDQCVDGEKLGGFTTKGIERVTDYLSAPSTSFRDPLPEDITFFTVMISDTDEVPFPIGYDPGCCDPATGIALAESIFASYEKVSAGSTFASNLWRRYDLMDETVQEMMEDGGTVTWWDWNLQTSGQISPNSTLLLPGFNTSAVVVATDLLSSIRRT